jgi:hypothetical protein
MVTIRRHPIPPDSYNPDRPLNALMRAQLEHFAHVAERLSPEIQVGLSVPSPEDPATANRFTAAVTEHLMSIKRPPLQIAKKHGHKSRRQNVRIAAQAESSPPGASKKKQTSSNSKSRSPVK